MVDRKRKGKKSGLTIEEQARRSIEREPTEKEKRRKDEFTVTRTKAPVQPRPTIRAEPKKTGIEKFAETPVGKVVTSPKTTAVLGAGLAALVTGGGSLAAQATGAGSRAVIGRTAFKHALITSAKTGQQRLVGQGAVATQRGFVGSPAKTGVNKLFNIGVKNAALRFPTNLKSKSLTTSLLTKVGLGVGAAGLFVGAVGSYPFAGFIKEEALQQLGFAFNEAERNNDIPSMELAIEETREILNAAPTILSKIPYANVLTQLKTFFEAAQTKLEVDEKLLEKRRGELATGETEFAEQRREVDEQARQRQLEDRQRDAEYFALIREGKFEEAQELLDAELKGGE